MITDCKEMISTYNKPLETRANRRIQKMFLDISHLNLKFEHIPGIKNSTVDFGSRRPRDSLEAVSEEEVPVKLRLGVRTVRCERMKIDLIDPSAEKLAEVGHTDPTYHLMIYHTEQQTDNKFLGENSELKKVGVVRKELGLFQCQNGRKLVVRNRK